MKRPQKGWKHTEEAIQKMRDSHANRIVTPEVAAKRKRPKSEAFKQYMSTLMTGRTKSEETKAKMRESALRRWAKRDT